MERHKHGMPVRWAGRRRLYEVEPVSLPDTGIVPDTRQPDLPLAPVYALRWVTPEQGHWLVNAYHTARTALVGTPGGPTPHQRMLWASQEFNKKYPTISSTAAYKDLCGLLDR